MDTPTQPTDASLWALAPDPDDPLEARYHEDGLGETGFLMWELRQQFRRGPCHVAILEGNIDVWSLVAAHRDTILRSQTVVSRNGKPTPERFILDAGEGSFVAVSDGDLTTYAGSPEKAIALANRFRKFIRPVEHKTVGFRMLCIDDGDISTQFIHVQRPLQLTDQALQLHYGEDFTTWEAQWLSQVFERSSGLSVLHGPPGCGKTTYLRALMGKLMESNVFYYLPVSEFNNLAAPSLVTFWINQCRKHADKPKLVIIEDAEELLAPRDNANRDAISNLLNICDGFLGDYLRIQIIATTNVPFFNLDPAVIRPGRLMGCREFPRLGAAEARKIADAKGIRLPDKPDFSLAEIYAHAPVGMPVIRTKRIGF